jgi:hypothetical protein
MNQIKTKLIIILLVLMSISYYGIGQPKYHTVPKQMMQNINMNNPTSPIVGTLPYYPNTEYPLATEDTWKWNVSDDDISDVNMGLTPLYSQQIVNDKSGNVLFFIVDNYIYNKYGYGFPDAPGSPICYKLKDNYNPHMPTSDDDEIYNKIIVVPVPNSCNEFFVFYAMLDDEYSQDLAVPRVYYKTITFINDEQIVLSDETELTLPDLLPACNDCSSFSMNITDYNSTYGDNLLVVQWLDQLRVFEITEVVNSSCISFNPYGDKNNNCFGSKRPDPVLTYDNNGNVVYIFSSTHGPILTAIPVIRYFNFSRDFSSLSSTSYTQDYVDYDNNQIICGMECSPNKNYLYVTFMGLSGIYYFNVSAFINNTGSFPTAYSTLSQTGDYRYSEIETFSNSKLYAINHNSSTGLGAYTSINTPNTPSSTTFSYSCFGGTQVKRSNLVNDSDFWLRYIFNFQIDDADYTTNYPSIYCAQPDWNTIGSTVTWSPGVNNNPFRSETGVVYFDEDFVIPAGKYIQLSNMEFNFASSKKAIVNIGSTLRLVGSTLTAADQCTPSTMWGGVYLEGNPTLDQSPANQGRLRMDAGSVISDATIGVYAEGGAICQIYGGDFINNTTSVYLFTYTHPTVPSYNASLIQNADFVTNAALNNGSTPVYMITLQTVKGINITSCNFINSRENSIAAASRGYGVRGVYSDFKVQSCDISGLYYGSYINFGTPKIISNGFANNFRSLYSGSSVNVEVTGNDFDGNFTFTPGSGNAYSSYIGGNSVNNTLYKFEENTIQNGSVGAQFYNLGPNAVKVKDNTFLNISGVTQSCAAVAIGKNSDFNGTPLTGTVGLEFRCNSFDDNPYALSVIDGNMRKYQGEQGANVGSDYAGNAFDHYGTNTERDFYVDLTIASSLQIPMYYYYSHSDNLYKILYYTLSRITNAGFIYGFLEEHCEELGIIKGMSVGEGTTIIEETDTEIMLDESELSDYTDDGNTLLMLSQAETMNTENSMAVSEDIADLDGYISDEVALAFITNSNANQFVKANALIENSPLPTSVIDNLDDMDMNPTLKNIVKNEQTGVNVREQKQAEIAEHKQFRALVINEMVVSISNSDIEEERVLLEEFLNNDNSLQSKFHLLNLQKNNGNFESAHSTLETIRQMVQNSELDFVVEYENFIELQHILLDIESQVLSVETAVENNLDLLTLIASTESYPGQIAAQYLLDDAGVIEYDEVVKLPEPAMSDKSIKFNNEQIVSESINYSDIINVYPNPVNEKIFVEYAFFNFNETSSIEIYGINGNLIYSEDLKQAVGLFTYNNQLPAGNYIIKVGENFTQKITVQ